MAFIKQVGETEETGVLQRVYEAARGRSGGVANIIRVMSRDGRSVQGSMQLYMSVMKADNALSAPRREMLASVVCNINECYF